MVLLQRAQTFAKGANLGDWVVGRRGEPRWRTSADLPPSVLTCHPWYVRRLPKHPTAAGEAKNGFVEGMEGGPKDRPVSSHRAAEPTNPQNLCEKEDKPSDGVGTAPITVTHVGIRECPRSRATLPSAVHCCKEGHSHPTNCSPERRHVLIQSLSRVLVGSCDSRRQG